MYAGSENRSNPQKALEAACPSVDDLARFIEKTAPPALTERILAHLDDCEACRVLLAAAMRDSRGETDDVTNMAFGPRTFRAEEVVSGRYRIVRLLSRGGMGEVYEAWDLQLSDSVALKTIACTGLDNASLYVRIRKEVQLARKVAHQNVCRILEFGLHQQSFRDQVEVIPFFTMDLLSGETLAEYLARRGKVPTGELLPIVAQILRGLSAIHAAGIVHRDLKPENIFLLHEPGGQLRVVVMDFGLARIEDGRVSSTQSSAASMVGTPNYMAPEQSLGSAPTVAWDIFALGVILYRAVAGELPFKGNTAVALAMARIKERAPRLSSAVPDVAPWFEQIVAKCLERTPASRYANVAELEHAFANRKPSRARSRSQLLGAGVLVAVGAVGVLAFAWQYSRHTQKHRPSAGSLASLAVQGNQASLAASPVTQASGVQSVVPLTPMPGQPIAAALESATVAGAKVPAIRARSVSRLAPTPVPSSLRVVSRPEVEALPPLPGEDEIVVPEFAKPTQKRVEP